MLTFWHQHLSNNYRIFLFDMHLKDTILSIDGGQLEIFQDKLRQQELDDGQETFQNDAVGLRSQT